jgi:hypothetical protein
MVILSTKRLIRLQPRGDQTQDNGIGSKVATADRDCAEPRCCEHGGMVSRWVRPFA